ncbi:hypothetical protein BFU36_10895 [Sulfolobus sp. A20]|uniref:hypothetical protein n=1 Tax=Sulfolobaceae TaxID=118883 RepID=UPI0008460543|nr:MULTISPECIES: hypothetical protein [unclassified Sulfolobus]TRM73865.1 hypothetical protein DJ528_11055 [Sulfolobus sp. B5]TRM75864.1 hypothetical protein DJ523_02155 [Sulfolobus sp. E5]TRM78388.1 hypothetical protein DJ532_01125 [Sulfolobus sp. A20-N-F8]TRM83643.1 hypothetical protein DJ531_04450 [Sulfolobus sp. A20-N-F6]TRM89096.1 hypothetical protein DJ529_03255 [Sulfolobus sp. C3]TRN02638.1 hypothetical protein DJ530_03980 [Sulfolobus sp. E1]TRN04186.1 hypothetical protein DJ527_00730
MKIKIKSIVKPIGEEELSIIPLAENGVFVECLNFYEDIEGGRQARLVVVLDKYGDIKFDQINYIKGKKTYIDAEGVDEDFNSIKKIIKLDRIARMYRVPLYFDIQIVDNPDMNSRGIKGLINYLAVHKEINITSLRNVVRLEVI